MDCVTIADAAAAELNNGSFSESFTADRVLLADFELSELSELKVSVVPKSAEYSAFCREYSQYDFSVDIGIQKKIDLDIETETGSLLGLVDEIAVYLRKRPLTDILSAKWLKTVNEPLYSQEHLVNHRTFTSVLTVTYRAVK